MLMVDGKCRSQKDENIQINQTRIHNYDKNQNKKNLNVRRHGALIQYLQSDKTKFLKIYVYCN